MASRMRAESREQRAKNGGWRARGVVLCALCSLLVFSWGCASLRSLLRGEKVLAVVEGVPITEEDLMYTLQIAHRREDLSCAGVLDLMQYVRKLIDDRLIIEEAYRMGLDQDPQIQQAIGAYILRESVVRLYNKEIVKKTRIREDDIRDCYKRNYDQVHIKLMEVEAEKEAEEILKQLQEGANFEELAKRYSIHASREKGGDIATVKFGSLDSAIKETISKLRPGEVSGATKTQSKYYIVKLEEKKEAPEEGFEEVKKRVEKKLRKEREKERSNEYLKYLRSKASLKIHNDVLSAIKIEELGQWVRDSRPVIEVNGAILTAGEFSERLQAALSRRGVTANEKLKENIINSWIDRKLVDDEALSRHYEREPDLNRMIRRYEDQLIKKTFCQKVIIPQITLSEETLKDYYLRHQESFLKPAKLRLRQITVKSITNAQDIVNQLRNGADFAWLAKRHSIDSAAPKGGAIGWLTRQELPEPLKEIVDTLRIGDISPVAKMDSAYRIFRLDARPEEEVQEFDNIKDAVRAACFKARYDALFKEYTDQLRVGAQIVIDEDAIRTLEKRLRK